MAANPPFDTTDYYDPSEDLDLTYSSPAGYLDLGDFAEAQAVSQASPSQLQGALSASRQRVMDLSKAYEKTLSDSDVITQRQQEILDKARERLLREKPGPSEAEMYFTLAAALGQPSKTGRFGEALGKISGAGANLLAQRRQEEDQNRALMDKYGLESGNLGLKSLDFRSRQLLSQLEAERQRAARYQLSGGSKTGRTPFGVEVRNGVPYWADETGVMRPHTLAEFYAMVAGAKAMGQAPWQTVSGPWGVQPKSEVLGTTSAGQVNPNAPGSSPPGPGRPPASTLPPTVGAPPLAATKPPAAVAPPVVGQPAAGAPAPQPSAKPAPGAPNAPAELDPRELESVSGIFTPFAGLPQEGALLNEKSVPVIQHAVALGLRQIPRFPSRAPAAGPEGVRLKAAIDQDAKEGLTIDNDLRAKASASDDVLKNYLHMFEDLSGGMRTGRIGTALTSIEEALSGVLPQSVISSFIDQERKSREQNFDKWALDAATRTLKMIYGGRIAVFEVQTAINASPGRSIAEKASYAIMKAKADWAQEQILKQQVWEEYRSRGGTVHGFEAWYRANVSLYYDNYVSRTLRSMSGAGGEAGVSDNARLEALKAEQRRRAGGG